MRQAKSNKVRQWWRRPQVVLPVIFVCIALAGLAYWMQLGHRSSAPVVTPTSTPGVSQPNTDNVGNQAKSVQTPGLSPSPTVASPSNNNIQVIYTRDPAQAGKGGPVIIRTLITGATTGECKLTFTGPAGQSFTARGTVATSPTDASAAVCHGNDADVEGMNVAGNLFSANGSWNVQLIVTSGNNTGSISKKQFTVEN